MTGVLLAQDVTQLGVTDVAETWIVKTAQNAARSNQRRGRTYLLRDSESQGSSSIPAAHALIITGPATRRALVVGQLRRGNRAHDT